MLHGVPLCVCVWRYPDTDINSCINEVHSLQHNTNYGELDPVDAAGTEPACCSQLAHINFMVEPEPLTEASTSRHRSSTLKPSHTA
jgi:hypothetical protein